MSRGDDMSLLIIGESDVGKSHYGAQVLRRLSESGSAMSLVDSTDLSQFKTIMDQISQGLAGAHTPIGAASNSRWTVRRESDGRVFDMNWPDYAGETLEMMVGSRRIEPDWQARIAQADAWVLMIRPSRIRGPQDILTRSPAAAELGNSTSQPQPSAEAKTSLSMQERLIEILQMLRYRIRISDHPKPVPPLCVVLSCYDELHDASGSDPDPRSFCQQQMPFLNSYLETNWASDALRIFGVSPLGQPLDTTAPNNEYIDKGPDKMGYVVSEGGQTSADLLAPIEWVLTALTKTYSS